MLDPTTPPAVIAHIAAGLALVAGIPTWAVLADLAEKLATWASAAETRG